MSKPNTYYNFSLVSKDELTGKALSKDSNISILLPNIFYTLTPIPTQILIPAPGLLGIYTDMNLQKTTMLVLKLFVKG